ncbi:aldehyde dehydrogenase family protein [Patescibacteria group bacterium]|nr:aldehyde dehydrogenase family protein [Patescibacteria group bacterium]
MVPAVLGNVTTDMRIMHEEQFGPVVPIVTYDDPQEVVDRVNNSPYGQQLSMFSQDPKEVQDFYSQINTEAGRVNINVQCQR